MLILHVGKKTNGNVVCHANRWVCLLSLVVSPALALRAAVVISFWLRLFFYP